METLTFQFRPSFSCQADGFAFDSRMLWGAEEFMVSDWKPTNSCGYETSPNNHPLTAITAGMRTSCQNVVFSLYMSHVLMRLKSCDLFRFSFVNLSHASMYLLDRRGFLLKTLLNKPYFFSHVFNCVVMDFNLLNEACIIQDISVFFPSPFPTRRNLTLSETFFLNHWTATSTSLRHMLISFSQDIVLIHTSVLQTLMDVFTPAVVEFIEAWWLSAPGCNLIRFSPKR